MKRDTLQFALMASLTLFSSLAFAGDKNKSASDNTQPAVTAAADNTSANNNPCVSTSDQKASNKKNNKNKAKPAPTDQEKEFDKVLMGIYG
jgi:hypothetical protein